MTGHLPGVGFSLRTGLCKVADLCVSTGTDKIPLSWGWKGQREWHPPTAVLQSDGEEGTPRGPGDSGREVLVSQSLGDSPRIHTAWTFHWSPTTSPLNQHPL